MLIHSTVLWVTVSEVGCQMNADSAPDYDYLRCADTLPSTHARI